MSLENSLTEYNISRKQLILATILCGTDYNDGVSGIGPKTAIDIVDENNTIEDVLDYIDDDINDIDEIFNLYMNPKVNDEYPDPKIPNPDTEEAREYLKQQEVSISEVDKSLREIDENSSQTGISSF
jgi:flap endonuclease-1